MENIFSSWRKKSSKFSKFSKFRKSRKSRIFLKFWKKTQHFENFWNFEIFWNFRKFLRFRNFRNFLRFPKIWKQFWNFFDRNFFSTKKCSFFFDDLFRSQISPRFQKSHLENRVMSLKMRKIENPANVLKKHSKWEKSLGIWNVLSGWTLKR